MDIHKNARLSFRSRELLLQQVVEHAWTLTAAAPASASPLRPPPGGSSAIGCRAALAKRSPVAPPSVRLPSAAFCGALAAVAGAICIPRPPRALRTSRPGDLLHHDIKGMTRFQQVSWRGGRRQPWPHKHPGWEALHVAVDDHSRLAFTRILPDQKADTTIAFLRAALDFFAHYGIRVRAVLTDQPL
jgi:hypothetical protein